MAVVQRADLAGPLAKLLNEEGALSDASEQMKYLTSAEVGAILRTPVETVRWWRHVGKGPRSFKVGRRVLYAAEDVWAFIEEARKAGAGSVNAATTVSSGRTKNDKDPNRDTRRTLANSAVNGDRAQ